MKPKASCISTGLLLGIFLLNALLAPAQSLTFGGKLEVGIGLGPMIFVGDLGGTRGEGRTFIKDVNLPLTKLSKGLFLSFFPAEWIGFRLAVNKSKLEGFDSIIYDHGSAETHRKTRNLHFRSPVSEAYVGMELYPTYFTEQEPSLNHKIRPYGIIGIGLFSFNPQGQYIKPNGERVWVDLKPLQLEGQGMAEYPNRKPYKLTQMHVPMGFGAKYYFGENKYIGFEILHRKTFTDYVDDVSTNYIDANLFRKYLNDEQATIARQMHYRENLSDNMSRGSTPDRDEQRGNPRENDGFFSSIIRMGWRIGYNDESSSYSGGGGRGRSSKYLRCPTFY